MFLSKRPNGVYHLYYEQSNGKITSILDFCKKIKGTADLQNKSNSVKRAIILIPQVFEVHS